MKESRYNVWVERNGESFVYNGVSGALLRMSAQNRVAMNRFLGGEPDSGCPSSLLSDLVRGQMVLADDVDELAFLAGKYNASQVRTDAMALTLVTSLGCNFACPYCFEDKHPSIMNREVQDSIFNLVLDKARLLRSLRITWFGGEPLVGKRVIWDLSNRFIPYCAESKINYSADIVTNGFLLDEETCVQLKDCKVQMAQVSIDGPPDIHDRMRPTADGKSTFWKIVQNLHHAVEYLRINIRINTDRGNAPRVEELLQILAKEGFAGKLSVYMGKITGVNDGSAAPSSSYKGCFRPADFAETEFLFQQLAKEYGFTSFNLPRAKGAPCTAVRENEYVVGSEGELYKCFDSVGNANDVFGNIRDYNNVNSRVNKWLAYTPFTNRECRHCVALPVCMGGCAHHSFDLNLYDQRCGTFRFTHHQQVLRYVDSFLDKKTRTPFARVHNGDVTPEPLPILV